jgi:hypothetical protein
VVIESSDKPEQLVESKQMDLLARGETTLL